MNIIYRNIKNHNGDKNIIDQNIDDICNNILNFTEKDIIALLVDLNVYYKICDNNIIDYCFRILTSIIESQDYSYNINMKMRIENIVMKLNHKYYSNFVHIKSILEHAIIDNEIDYYSDNDNLLINYLILLLTKNCDDIYDIGNLKDQIKKKIENKQIIYHLMRKIIKYPLVDDLYQMIFNDLDFVDQHKFRIMNIYFQKFQIVRLGDNCFNNFKITFKYANKFNQNILDNYKFAKSLSIVLTLNRLNIDHMTNLRYLHVSQYDTYCDKFEIFSEKLTGLRKLSISLRKQICNLNHLTNLKKLYIYSLDHRGFDNSTIKNLSQLEELHIYSSYKSLNINHMTDLKILNISGGCIVSDECIKNLLNLEQLYLKKNNDMFDYHNDIEITSLNHMTNLKILHLLTDNTVTINDEGIKYLTQLEELHIKNAHNITDLNHMTNLKILNIDDCNIDNKGIKKLLQLERLLTRRCINITSIEHLTKLKYVDVDVDGITIDSCLMLVKCGLDVEDCCIRLGKYFRSKDNYDEAITYFKLALDDRYCNDEYMFLIGDCYEKNEKYDEAITYYNLAIDDGYSKSECMFSIGNCHRMKDNYDEAIKFYKLASDNRYEKNKKYVEAISYYNLAMDNCFDRSECMFLIGYCHRMKDNYDEAISYYKLALDNGYEKSECMYWIGDCYENDERYDGAISYYNSAMDNGYDKSDCLFLIGDCHRMKDNYDKAMTYYNLAMDNGYNKNDCMNEISKCLKLKDDETF